jgi:hypothetical protein
MSRRKCGPDRRLENFHNEELHNIFIYSSPNIVRVIIKSRLRWAWQVTHIEEVRST